MKLIEYYNRLSRSQKKKFMDEMCQAHGVTPRSVRFWMKDTTKRHRFTLQSVQITERLTKGHVTRHDLRPDVFGDRAA